MKKYKTIVIDPPWKYSRSWDGGSEKSALSKKYQVSIPMPYNEMSVNEIKQLPIIQLCETSTDVYIWVTQKYLPKVFEIADYWGLRYCQTLTWCKTPMGTGQGALFCPTSEFLVLFRTKGGKMPENKKRIDSTWWQVTRQKRHSQKPELFQSLIESVSDSPRLEMFARREREGWDVFGNEVSGSIDLDIYHNCK